MLQRIELTLEKLALGQMDFGPKYRNVFYVTIATVGSVKPLCLDTISYQTLKTA